MTAAPENDKRKRGRAGWWHPREMMMREDVLGYLPDDILVKVDRSTMAVSLESRTPYLDHRVVEYATALPLRYKIRGSRGKWVLRQLLYRQLPAHLVERPKHGFGPPLNQWLQGPLRDWGEALLDEQRLRNEGFLRARLIRQLWEEHGRGARRLSSLLWAVLMFQRWLESRTVSPAMV